VRQSGLKTNGCEVACVGILVADLFADPVEQLPGPGELTTTSGLSMRVGGCAANTASALRTLGHTVEVAGKVGRDMQGDFITTELERRGIGVRHIRRAANCSTSGTVVLSVAGEDRRYLHCIGANAQFAPADLDVQMLAGVNVLYFGGYLAMPSFAANHVAELFQQARSQGSITVLDVAMPAGSPFTVRDVAPVLEYTDYFLPNNQEGKVLTGFDNECQQAECLNRINPACTVVITRGAHGSLACREGQFVETPPFHMDSIDESGAGDAFAAGLIAGLMKHWDLQRVLAFAAAVGASCTRQMGCFEGIFTFEEALSFLDSNALVKYGGDTVV